MIIAHIRSSFAEAFFPRVSEWTPAVIITGLGWVLLVNEALMRTGTGKGYALMLSIAEQRTWAISLIVFGLCRITILFINGAWRRSPIARALAAALSMFFWTQIMLSFAPVFGFAFVAYAGFLGMDLVNIFRAMRDARIVDDAFAAREQGNGRRGE